MRRESVYWLTRADSLVVLVLGVFLLAVAGPSASKPRAQARRAVCRANLGQIGKAMLIYAGDYNGALPRAGGPSTEWGTTVWDAGDRDAAYGISPGGKGGTASISSCFYLLVKYLEMPPPLFVCPGDVNTVAFELGAEDVARDVTLIDAWDFGRSAYARCSYSYHIPFGAYALNTSRDPNLAVAADRNPWIDSPAGEAVAEDYDVFWPDVAPYCGTAEAARRSNAVTHERDGQNVLFLDGRVSFEPRAYSRMRESYVYAPGKQRVVEVGGDNIYTQSAMANRGEAKGYRLVLSASLEPLNEADSLLVHDPPDADQAE